MSDSQPIQKVNCPRCRKECEYTSENNWRPFCSERCKLIDLGQWASEKYAIPTEEPPDLLAEPEEQNKN